jgi:hypothetical protein
MPGAAGKRVKIKARNMGGIRHTDVLNGAPLKILLSG